jgi:hypothetical protein
MNITLYGHNGKLTKYWQRLRLIKRLIQEIMEIIRAIQRIIKMLKVNFQLKLQLLIGIVILQLKHYLQLQLERKGHQLFLLLNYKVLIL